MTLSHNRLLSLNELKARTRASIHTLEDRIKTYMRLDGMDSKTMQSVRAELNVKKRLLERLEASKEVPNASD